MGFDPVGRDSEQRSKLRVRHHTIGQRGAVAGYVTAHSVPLIRVTNASTLAMVSKFSGRRSASSILMLHSLSSTVTKSTSVNESSTPERNRDESRSGKSVRASAAA